MPKDTTEIPIMAPSLFECSDGVWIHLMGDPGAAPLMQQSLAEMGDDAIAAARAADPDLGARFVDGAAKVAALKQRPSDEWLTDLWASDVPVQAAVPLGTLYDDEQCHANGYVITLEDPDFGTVQQAGIPFTTTPASMTLRPAPRLGANTDSVRWDARPAAPPCASTTAQWPLAGVKVVDFGAYLAGPIAPMMLADLGAEVIKVEPPSGDFMRMIERTFAGCQRGKRGLALDLKHPDARAVVAALARWADVVHHNVRMPAAAKLGIDEATLRQINPSLVYCHVSSYGPAGPRADWPGFDQLFQAASGWEYEGAGDSNPPMWHRFGMMDHQGGMASLVATLLALLWRERTGEGQFCAASLLGASVLTTSETMKLADGSLAPYDRLDREQHGVRPGRRIVPVADGWVAIDTTDDLGAEVDALAGGTVDDVLSTLSARGVPCAAARLDQMNPYFDDSATWSSRLAVRYPHAKYGEVEQVGTLWDFGELSTRLDRASPEIGQHSHEILGDLGFDDDAIASLIDSGAVTQLSR
jgi:crotonobetainyl-CoA:carnitine CoA-transferase CaiB-like acyl-CoA transferase